MKRLHAVGVLVALAASVAAFQQPTAAVLPEPKLYRIEDLSRNSHIDTVAILGGTLVDGNDSPPLENAAIVIRGDRITAVGKVGDVEIPADALRVLATGKTIMPGLIDMHVHLNQGDDLQLFLAAGVTTVRDVGNYTSIVVPLERGTRSNDFLGPRIFFSGESFAYRGGFAPFQRPTKDAVEARTEVRKRIASGASVIKIINDITPELVEAIVDEAHQAGVPVTADILGNRLTTAARAIALGVDGLEHVSGVPQSIQTDHSPAEFSEAISIKALLGWLYTDRNKESALVDMIVKRGTYIVPTFATLEARSGIAFPTDPAIHCVSDGLNSFWKTLNSAPQRSNSVTGEAFRTHFIHSQPFVAKVAAAGGRIVAGTDVPTPGVVPGFSMHRELELLVQAGLTPMKAIQAATKTAAKFLGKSHDLGTIEAGRLADIIIVNGTPQRQISDIRGIETIFRDGNMFDASELLHLSKCRR